jgi:hypothetical protein
VLGDLPEGRPGDRLALAQWLASESHPLTARVAVNRFWQLMFGVGIVRTAEDFGSQGEWPSHPELLDTLAVEFKRGGWNVRALLKEMVMSAAYQQTSEISASMLEQDPYNRLLARAPRTRLPAELVRDNAMAISGLLNPVIGGPSAFPDQPEGLWRQVSHFGHGGFFSAQAYFDSISADRYRRSMYTAWKRTAPPPAMAMFDAPTRETCTVRRMKTNTPLQALVLMNDPQFVDAAPNSHVPFATPSDSLPHACPPPKKPPCSCVDSNVSASALRRIQQLRSPLCLNMMGQKHLWI